MASQKVLEGHCLVGFGRGNSNQIVPCSTKNGLPPTIIENFNGVPLKCALAGEFHSAVLTESGKVFTWGNQCYGECGRESDLTTPQELKIPGNEFVEQLSTGCNHLHIITSSRKVYTVGYNSYSQLGICNRINIRQLTRVTFFESQNLPCVDYILSGYFFTLFILQGKDQHLYVCGQNNYSQLGIPTADAIQVPIFHPLLNNDEMLGEDGVRFRHIVCGGYFIVVQTGNYEVHCFGDNNAHQLGSSEQSIKYFKPPELQNLRFLKITCGHSHTVALTVKHEMFVWGNNAKKQINCSSQSEIIEPQIIKLLPQNLVLANVEATRDGIYLFSTTRKMYAIGSNTFWQLGVSKDVLSEANEPYYIEYFDDLNISALHSKYQHSLVIIKPRAKQWNEKMLTKKNIMQLADVTILSD